MNVILSENSDFLELKIHKARKYNDLWINFSVLGREGVVIFGEDENLEPQRAQRAQRKEKGEESKKRKSVKS